MPLNPADIADLAERLERAELGARALTKITDDHPDMDWEDAYAIQNEIRQRKIDSGHRIVGFKAGLTSRAKMRQMGLDKSVYGFLADYFAVAEGGSVATEELIHPKVEPEIAFVLKEPLRGPGCHIGHVLAATDFILPAIEIVDSRYRNYDFDLPSVIADNSSSARFVLGSRAVRPDAVDIRTLGIIMEVNGDAVAYGAAAAVLGHPAASVAMIANQLAQSGEEIPAGAIILTGGITEAISVGAGDHIALHIQALGSVSISMDLRRGRRENMPFAQITLLEGRTEEQKRAVIKKVTQALCEAVDAPPENVRVWIVEVSDTNWGIGGAPVKDLGR